MKHPKYNILLIVRHPGGGIRTFLRYNFNNFDPNNYALTIITPKSTESQQLITDLSAFNVTPIWVSSNARAVSFLLSIILQLLTSRYSIIYSHGFTSCLISSVPAFLFKVPHLTTFHDVFTENQVNSLFMIILLKLCYRLLYLVNTIHCISNDAKLNYEEYITNAHTLKTKFVVIPNGIEISQFMVNKARDFRSELNLSKDTFLIGFFGRFMSQKGFKYLIDAIHHITTQQISINNIVVLSFGWGGFIREEQRTLTEKGLDRYFVFLPFVPNIAESLRGLDVVVMPSLWETCPLLPMETMVSGTPLIATNCIGLREVIHNTPTKVIPAKSSKDLAKAILDEISDPSKNLANSFKYEAARRFNVKLQAYQLNLLILNHMKSNQD